jgi:hypothetical protein
MAALVSRRTNLPVEAILALLEAPAEPAGPSAAPRLAALVGIGPQPGATGPFTDMGRDAIIGA